MRMGSCGQWLYTLANTDATIQVLGFLKGNTLVKVVGEHVEGCRMHLWDFEGQIPRSKVRCLLAWCRIL